MDVIKILDILMCLNVQVEMYMEWRRLQRKQKIYIKDAFTDRETHGCFELNFIRLRNQDPEVFRTATRMSPSTFDVLFNLVKEGLMKNSFRKPISSESRLFLTFIYLAHGGSRQFLSLSFKMGVTTIRRITLETCEVLWDTLSEFYLSLPNESEWEKIAADFQNIWNFPNCVGAIDGKHINIVCPQKSGSLYYNYKGTYSICLLAVCGANYVFTVVDIGAYGSQSDGGVLRFCNFGKRLMSGKLDLPKDKPLSNAENPFPFYFVGDAAFSLKTFLMRPYPGRILDTKEDNFNKRLSRARRTIENAFGILTARWRILRTTLQMSEKSAETVVEGAVLLHNFLKMSNRTYCPINYTDSNRDGNIIEGLWRQEVRPLQSCRALSSNNPKKCAITLRNELRDYVFTNNN